MTSYNHSTTRPSGPRGTPQGAAATSQTPGMPGGIFQPHTKVQVGQSRVVIDRYLSEGGFAHVYVVKLPKPISGEDKAVLKRVAVPDKEALATMRTEIETMKKLRGHRHIVTYFDSHASQLQGGGYEVFVLMEFCSGGSLIDFMNTRLQNRLSEPEILQIFSHAAQGIACMHYLKPPLLHRDIKIENILISTSGSSKIYKLCDFGSSAPPRPAATTATEGKIIEEDIQRHTTMQYRSPEMIDVYRKQPIDEKSDIWALGVFLYKLCYYTTPFEEQGQMAILNASFRFPKHPQFSDRLKRLIAMMLQEKPSQRPNIYQVICEVCSMRGSEVPIKDIYADRSASEARRNQQLPTPTNQIRSPPIVGAVKVAPVEEKLQIPDIKPMRRGRPTKSSGGPSTTNLSPSPGRVVDSDPFAALDSNGSKDTRTDELSSRFPTLDQFSLLHNSTKPFSFESKKPDTTAEPRDLSQRVTEALADDAFAAATARSAGSNVDSIPPPHTTTRPKIASTQENPASKLREFSARKTPSMVSTGTMTLPESEIHTPKDPSTAQRPIYRFPSSDQRASSHSRIASAVSGAGPELSVERSGLKSHSQTNLATKTSPVLNVARPPTLQASDDKVESTQANMRAVSSDPAPIELSKRVTSQVTEESSPRIDSNVEFLRQMEEDEASSRKREKRASSGSMKQLKRSSLPSISLSGTKSMLAGRFGEAFKRFETNTASGDGHEDGSFHGHDDLTPIEGSETTDRRSDDGNVLEESDELPPEVRRELERRRLSQEERRVAQAAAAYKQRVSQAGGGSAPGAGKAAAIQSKVQALLDESTKPIPGKTAEGYGRFTEASQPQTIPSSSLPKDPGIPPGRTASLPMRSSDGSARTVAVSTTAAASTGSRSGRPSPAPGPKPKPQSLRAGGAGPSVVSKPAALAMSNRTGPAALLQTRSSPLPPVSSITQHQQSSPRPGLPATTLTAADAALGSQHQPAVEGDWEENFSKRYPSLAGLEMVETQIGTQRLMVGTSGTKETDGSASKWRDI